MQNLKLWLIVIITVIIIGIIVGVVLGLRQRSTPTPVSSAIDYPAQNQPTRPAIKDKSGNYTQEYEEGRARAFEALRQEILQQRGY